MTKKTKELKYNEIINIRHHHLLCINGYQGYGYDSRFRENLNLIHNIIFKNKDDNRDNETPKIAIVIENNDINKNTNTKNNNSVNNDNINDNNIHNAYNINGKYWKQNIYSPKYLFNIINQKIKNRENIRGICDNCSWESKCLFIKKLK